MKKFFVFGAIAMMMIVSCGKEDIDTLNVDEKYVTEAPYGVTYIKVDDNTMNIYAYNYADGLKMGPLHVSSNGEVGIISDVATSVELYSLPLTKAGDDSQYLGSYTVVPSTSWASIKKSDEKIYPDGGEYFRNLFGAGVDNVAKYKNKAPAGVTSFSMDFLYKSDGSTFGIYPVYSMGWYDITLGLFYFDKDNVRHDVNFWNMQTDNWGKKTYEYLSQYGVHNVSDYEISKSEAEGYEVTLPEGVLFGFYVSSSHNDPACGTYYTATMLNDGDIHAASFNNGSMTYIGFEDQKGGDNDINDLICYVNPKQVVVVNPTMETVADNSGNIVEPTVVPTSADKLVHVIGYDPFIDVEGRFDDPYPYVRVSVPLMKDGKFTIDVSQIGDFTAPEDDVHIVTAGDIAHKELESLISRDSNNKNVITVTTPDGAESGEYEFKIELRPMTDFYSNLISLLKSMEGSDFNWYSIYTNLASNNTTPTNQDTTQQGGTSGDNGNSGNNQGNSGDQGSTGDQGNSGNSGNQGNNGGDSGNQGNQGNNGNYGQGQGNNPGNNGQGLPGYDPNHGRWGY